MIDEISFLKDLINRWDNSLELMTGVDGRIYRLIQDRIENLTKHNSSFIQDLTAEYHCPHCKEAVNPNQLEKWKAKGSPK